MSLFEVEQKTIAPKPADWQKRLDIPARVQSKEDEYAVGRYRGNRMSPQRLRSDTFP